jgi:hypothetical protein
MGIGANIGQSHMALMKMTQRAVSMNRINCAAIATSAWLAGSASAGAQQDVTTQRAVLKEIRETAAAICYTVEQRGQKSEAQLTGEVQAQVTGVIAKAADLGVKGSGHLSSQEYQGVSQDALGAALTASANCRERVFNKLVDKILPPAKGAMTTPRPTLGQTAVTQRRSWSYTAGGILGSKIYENCFTVSDSRNRFDLVTAHLEKTVTRGAGGAAITSRSPQEICIRVVAPDGSYSDHEGNLVVNEVSPPP